MNNELIPILFAYGTVCTAMILLLWPHWAGNLATLAIQALLLTGLQAVVLPLHWAFAKLVTTLFVLLILYVTAQQTRLPSSLAAYTLWPQPVFSWGTTAGLLLLTLGLAWAWPLSSVGTLAFNVALFALLLLGLGRFLSAVHPFLVGIGVLTMLNGLELVYLSPTTSGRFFLFLALTHFVVAVVVSYLMQQTGRAAASSS